MYANTFGYHSIDHGHAIWLWKKYPNPNNTQYSVFDTEMRGNADNVKDIQLRSEGELKSRNLSKPVAVQVLQRALDYVDSKAKALKAERQRDIDLAFKLEQVNDQNYYTQQECENKRVHATHWQEGYAHGQQLILESGDGWCRSEEQAYAEWGMDGGWSDIVNNVKEDYTMPDPISLRGFKQGISDAIMDGIAEMRENIRNRIQVFDDIKTNWR